MARDNATAVPQLGERTPSRPKPPVVLLALMAVEGAAFAVLADVAGGAVVAVIAVTLLAIWFTRRTGQEAAALPQALAAAGSDPRIRAVVADGAKGQQLADHGWRPRNVDGILQRGVEWVQYTAAGLLSDAPRPMSIPDAIRAADGRPTLIIAAGAVADEPVAARWFQAASPATVQVWVVPHAGHTQGLATAPRAWEAHVIGFLDAALKP